MTAKGELYVDENIRDLAEEEITTKVSEIYGRDTHWKIDASHYSNVWEEENLPKNVYGNIIIALRNGEQRLVGKVSATLTFEVEGEGADKYIETDVEMWSVEMFDKPERWNK